MTTPKKPSSLEAVFPNITLWVKECGIAEIGYDPNTQTFIRAIDEGGMVWSGESQDTTLDDAFQDLEAGLGQILVERVLGAEPPARKSHSPKRSAPRKTAVRRRKRPPEDPLTRQVKKLDAIVEAIRGNEDVQVTRLTVVKKLCEDTTDAGTFALFLARKGQERLREKRGNDRYLQLATLAVREMKSHLDHPTEDCKKRLRCLLLEIEAEQNEFVSMRWGAVRNIKSWDLLIVEETLKSIVRPQEAEHWLYQASKYYVGGSIVFEKRAIPLIEEIARFWREYFRVKQ